MTQPATMINSSSSPCLLQTQLLCSALAEEEKVCFWGFLQPKSLPLWHPSTKDSLLFDLVFGEHLDLCSFVWRKMEVQVLFKLNFESRRRKVTLFAQVNTYLPFPFCHLVRDTNMLLKYFTPEWLFWNFCCCSCFSPVGELFDYVILHETRTGLCSGQASPALGLEVQSRTSTKACSSREHILTFTHTVNL